METINNEKPTNESIILPSPQEFFEEKKEGKKGRGRPKGSTKGAVATKNAESPINYYGDVHAGNIALVALPFRTLAHFTECEPMALDQGEALELARHAQATAKKYVGSEYFPPEYALALTAAAIVGSRIVMFRELMKNKNQPVEAKQNEQK